MAFFSFFLLVKPAGGFRTIGLLSCFYRIWAKVRMPLVRAWGASLPRAFYAAGVGKSTEQAVGRLLLASEGLKPDQEAAMLVDGDGNEEEDEDIHKLQCQASADYQSALQAQFQEMSQTNMQQFMDHVKGTEGDGAATKAAEK